MRKLITFALAATMFVACGTQKPLTNAQYEQSVRKDMPFEVSEFKQVKPDVYAFIRLCVCTARGDKTNSEWFSLGCH